MPGLGRGVGALATTDRAAVMPPIHRARLSQLAELRHGSLIRIRILADGERHRSPAGCTGPRFKVPKHGLGGDPADLPTTATGKVQRFCLVPLAAERIRGMT
jgi:hypothetical protein